jgi:predicted esterase
MHGLGDSADGFSDVAEMFSSQLPHVKFILPTAPSSPVTLNGGMVMNSWYDIVGLDDRASETCDGLDDSRNIVNAIVQQEVALGIPHSRIVLAGFSQVRNSL